MGEDRDSAASPYRSERRTRPIRANAAPVGCVLRAAAARLRPPVEEGERDSDFRMRIPGRLAMLRGHADVTITSVTFPLVSPFDQAGVETRVAEQAVQGTNTAS